MASRFKKTGISGTIIVDITSTCGYAKQAARICKYRRSIRLFSDRLFITKDLPLKAIQKSWRDAMQNYSTWALRISTMTITQVQGDFVAPDDPVDEFDSEYNRIVDKIVAAANKETL